MSKTSIILLWIAVFFGYLAFGATIQALPGFVTHQLKASVTTAGWTIGIAFIATAICRPIAGWLADAGKSRIVVSIGGLLTALGGAGHLLSNNVAEIMCARVVMGAGEAALFSGAIPWILATIPPVEKGKVAGWFGMSMWGGLALGPVVASLILSLQHNEVFGVWVLVTALGIILFLLVICVSEPQAPSELRSPFTVKGLFPKGSPLPGVVFGMSAYGYGAINAILILSLIEKHSPLVHYALAIFAFSFLFARFFGSPLITKHGGHKIWLAFLLIETAGLVIVAVPLPGILQPVGTIIGTSLSGIGLSLMFPATVAVTLGRTGKTAPGTSVAVMTSFWDFGLMVAGPLSGFIAEKIGYPQAFLLAAVVSFIALILGQKTSTSLAEREVQLT